MQESYKRAISSALVIIKPKYQIKNEATIKIAQAPEDPDEEDEGD